MKRCLVRSLIHWSHKTLESNMSERALSSDALAMGQLKTNWELGFRQSSFHHTMQVLRNSTFCVFSVLSAFPPCSCPLAFRPQVKRLTYGTFPSIPILLSRDTVLTIAAHRS